MKRLAIALTLLAACAPMPTPETTATPLELRDAARCAENGPCFIIQADNQKSYPAIIYINGSRIGEVQGNSHATFSVRESLLVEGGCAYAVAVLRLPNIVLGDQKQCIGKGGYYGLTIGVEGKLWLNAWGARR